MIEAIATAQAAFDAAVSRELGDLLNGTAGAQAASTRASCAGPPAAGAWRLPAPDLSALTEWGLPVFEPHNPGSVHLAGGIQGGQEPELCREGIAAYRLGRYWQRAIGAVADSGTVVGFPEGEASEDLAYINTSVCAFVEISWRWYLVRRALMVFDEADDDRLYELLEQFIEFAHTVDPAAEDDRYWWWDGVLGSW